MLQITANVRINRVVYILSTTSIPQNIDTTSALHFRCLETGMCLGLEAVRAKWGVFLV